MELLVIFALSKAPSLEAWQTELASSKAPVRFVEKVDLLKHSGFLPMQVQGRNSGFYFLRENFTELASHHKALTTLSVKNPSVYSLGYGGHFDECAAAFYSAAALVRLTGGSAFEPQGGTIMSESELIEAAKTCLDMAKSQ